MIHPVSACATDLGVEICIDAIVLDTWCIRLRTRVTEAPMPVAISSARLETDTIDGHIRTRLDVLPLVSTVPLETGQTELLFGAVPHAATDVTLVVTRLVTVDAGFSDPPFPQGHDPFDPLDEASDPRAVATFHHQEDDARDHPMPWEIRGAWRCEVALPDDRPITGQRVPLALHKSLGSCAIALPWMAAGAHATLVAIDVVNPRWAAWGALWKSAALSHDLALPVPRISLSLSAGDGWSASPLGPYGLHAARTYYIGPPLETSTALRAEVRGIYDVALDPPLTHRFDPRAFEPSATFTLDLTPLGESGELRFEIVDVYGDDATFLLLYRTELISVSLEGVWISCAALVDGDEVEHICQEEGTQPLREAGLEAAPDVRAMRFGRIRSETPVILRVSGVDLAWKRPQPLTTPPSDEREST